MTNLQSDVLSLFNCLVVNDRQEAGNVFPGLLEQGIVTDFTPEGAQLEALEEFYKPLPITTLFTREERENAPIEHLIIKQVMHYIEVYGLGAPGLFDLEVTTGNLVSMNYVSGISVGALEVLVQTLLYRNAPVKDAKLVQRIIDGFNLTFDINRVVNNELRVLLWNDQLNAFDSGDDAVRYLCHQATGDALLIKSKEVIAAVKKVPWLPYFFELHEQVLAEVFNRHKGIILAAKNKKTATAINRITRRSKTAHVPIKEAVNKKFIRLALSAPAVAAGFDAAKALKHCTVRDKLKFLNLLAVKRVQSNTAAYRVRNGKVFIRGERPVYTHQQIGPVEYNVLLSLASDLAHLKGQSILLDPHVDYGLPTTRKQTVGQLPFGTMVHCDGEELSSGMYWENEWGASDLDLSTIDLDGNRVGWGGRSGYDHGSIIFSGDLTNARNGAMEFMTSRDEDYGLFVNIYSGNAPSDMELVIGTRSPDNKQWMDDVLIREKHTLTSRNSIIGFVRGKSFMVYAGRLNNSRISGDNPIVNESKVNPWTMARLFTTLGIKFDVDRDGETEYDHDLSYSSFSFDKLEAVFAE